MKQKYKQKPRPKRNRTYVPVRNNRRIIMSRSIALADVEQELQEITTLQEKIVQDYQSYHNDVSDAIKQTLEGAGVWDTIHDLELERESVRKKGEEKLLSLRQRQQEALKIKEWILKRAPEEAPMTEPASSNAASDLNEEDPQEAETLPVNSPVEVEEIKASPVPPDSGKKKKPAPPRF